MCYRAPFRLDHGDKTAEPQEENMYLQDRKQTGAQPISLEMTSLGLLAVAKQVAIGKNLETKMFCFFSGQKSNLASSSDFGHLEATYLKLNNFLEITIEITELANYDRNEGNSINGLISQMMLKSCQMINPSEASEG